MQRTLKGRLLDIVEAVEPQLKEYAKSHDEEGTFVEEGFSILKDQGFFGALVPTDLGGLGAPHSQLCEALRRLAKSCSATALSASMHSHLVAAAVWKHLHGKGGAPLLKRVAAEGLVLISTGAGDWLESNGTMERVEGGYRVTAVKPFGSGSPYGDIMVTSAVYNDPERGERVLHFGVPFKAEGVTLGNDWDSLGMRGTGSNTNRLDEVFVPDAAISLDRPRQGWHPAWSVVLTVAAPIYMAPYLGVAEAARDIALEKAKKDRERPHVPIVAGEMEAALLRARLAFDSMVENANDFDFEPTLERANHALAAKTLLAESAEETVSKAMELVGGRAYFKSTGLERCMRDVVAGQYHPLPAVRQRLFTGRIALGMDPV